MPRPDRPWALWVAVLLSLGAHLFLWAGLPRTHPASAASSGPQFASEQIDTEPIDAEIVETQRPTKRVSLSSPPPRAPHHGRPSPLPPSQALGPGLSSTATPAPSWMLGDDPIPGPEATGEGAGTSTEATSGRDVPGTGVGGTSVPGGPYPSGATDDTLSLVEARLARAAVGCYPPTAARLSLVGTSVVRFCVGPGGAPTSARLITSSGQELLDDAATGCVLGSAAPFPETTRCFVVPVAFARR